MSDQVLAPDFLDMTAFYLAVSSVDQVIGSMEADPSAQSGVDLVRLQQHRKDGDILLRRIASSVDAGIDSLLRDAAEKSKLRVKTRIDASLRGAAYPAYRMRADFLEFFYPKLRAHTNVLRDVFGDDTSQATKITQAAGVMDPLPRLFKLAGIRLASGKLSLLKRWTQEATSICGNPVSEIEEVAVDVVATDMILDKVARNSRKLDTLDPNDPAAAAAEQENVELLEKVSRVAEKSKDPASVKAHAAAKLARGGKSGNNTTTISAHLDMTPEQEDAMLVRGKCVIAAGAGSGKCVTGDTLVSTMSGMRRIDECSGTMSLPSVNAESLVTSTEQATWIDMGTSPVIEIKTRSGVTLRGTPEHPLLTWDGKPSWTRLDTMKAGDFVLLQPGHAANSGTSVMDPEEAYLLGLLMGDGWVDVPGRRVGWSRGGDFLPQHFYNLADQFWGKTPKPTQKEGTNSITHWIHSAELVQRLDAQGVAFSSARDKSVPAAFLSATDAERIRFLQGLFDTDGTATGDRVVEWASASETLARQVHQMLIGLGVVGMLRPKLVGGYDHTYWRILIGGDQLRNFQENIGFRYDFKKTDDLAEICSNDCNPNVGVYPHVQDLLTQVREDWKSSGRWNGRKQSLLMDERWVQVKHYTQGTRMPSRAKLLQLTSGCDSQAATTLRNLAGYYPDEIESVQLVPGEHRVYDFTVPTTHSFIANGIVSHNTRVLAGKVIHHVQDLGLSMSNVMAMSFTKDSAEELKERIAKYASEIGFPIPDLDRMTGIGTTHSVGFTILKESKRGGGDVLKDGDISNLMRVAIAQVKMKAGTGQPPLPPKDAMTFFPNVAPSARQIEEPERAPAQRQNPAIETQSPVQNPVEAKSPLDFYLQDDGRFKTLINAAIDTLNDFLASVPKVKVTQAGKGYWIEVFGPGIDNFWDILSDLRIDGSKLNFAEAEPNYRQPRRFKGWNTRGTTVEKATAELRDAVGANKAENAVKALQSMSTLDPKTLPANEREILEGIITHPLMISGLTRRNVLVKTAAEKEAASTDGVKAALERKMKVLNFDNSPYKYWVNNPAGQWFNLGATDADFEVTDDRGEKKMVPVGEFSKFTSFNKNSLKAPGAIFLDSQKSDEVALGDEDEEGVEKAQSQVSKKIFAAVYGAYEWLKGNIPQIKGSLDFDDMLIQPTRELIESPALLNKYQKQYKCILVDEAQDLNAAQHLFIGLVAGYLDPQTLKPRASGKMSADTFAFIGDDKQCVEINSPVSTVDGLVPAGKLKPGDKVLAYRNGSVVPQTIRHVVPSKWDHGLTITTESGNTLTMSPNHRLWATTPQTEEGQTIVYLMHRGDMGFRVGITNKGKVGSEGDYLNSFGGRCFLEKAERLWVLEIAEDREAALLAEIQYSLRYGIPTTVFNGEHRDLNQDRIWAIFQEFGKNGMRLLESKHLSFDLPHWMSQSYSKHGRERHTINLLAHCSRSTQVSMEWSGDKFDAVLVGFGVSTAPGGRRRLRRRFPDYREALSFSEEVSRRTGAQISHRLSTPEESLREIPAAGLFVGMSVPILDGEGVVLDKITSITEVPGSFVDLDVDDASNFFAGGILTHNCIYEFRAADPDQFIEKSDLREGGEGFTTKLLDTNFRSGNAIVQAANKLIAFNSKQIPMTCKSNPKEGEGTIQRLSVQDLDVAAAALTDGILADLKDVQEAGKTGKFFSNYGLAVRTNKELATFAMKMIEEGIPFRSKKNFLGGPAIGPIIGLFTTLRTDSVQARNKGILDGVKAPDFGVNGPKLGEKMDELKVTDYYDFLVNQKGAKKVYYRREMVDKLQAYADYLEEITKIGSGSATDLINFIINFKGPDGDTLVDSLSASLMDDAEAMSEIQMVADEGDGQITPEMIADYAMTPINPLLKAAKKFPLAIQFTDYITTLVEANKKNEPKRFKKGETEPKPSERPDAVQLGTVHGWKGLEVENLYIPMWDGGFPHKRSMEDPKMMESERRLAYVALTRGRQRVTILEPKIVNDKDVQPSVFMSESCIPLVGTTKDESEKAASFNDYLKTANVSDFLVPMSKIGQVNHMAHKEPQPEALEAQWGRLATPQEEN